RYPCSAGYDDARRGADASPGERSRIRAALGTTTRGADRTGGIRCSAGTTVDVRHPRSVGTTTRGADRTSGIRAARVRRWTFGHPRSAGYVDTRRGRDERYPRSADMTND